MNDMTEGIINKQNNFNHYIKYIVASIYSIIICIYPYPKGYDISRFISFYKTYQSEEMFGDHFWRILFQTPDFIAKLFIAALAYTNLPIEIFFITFTFTTVCFLFLFFEKFHVYHTKQLPHKYAYLIFTLCLPVAAILSGIRNIHAWSVVLLVFMEYYSTKRKNYWALLYAATVHFASFIFFPLLFFIEKFQELSIKKIGSSAFLIGLFIKVLIILDVKEWMFITPHAVSLKLEFYLDKSTYLLGRVEVESYKGFLYRLSYLYSPLFLIILGIYKKSIDTLNAFWLKLGLAYYFLFFFYPDILNRFCMLLNMIILVHLLVENNVKKKYFNLWMIYIIVFSLVTKYLFWKSVFINQ